MSNLIPVQRADKNGKIVTRHVKNGKTPGKALSAAAPSLSPRLSVPQMRRKLAKALNVDSKALREEISDPQRLKALLKLAESHDLSPVSAHTAERLNRIEGKDFYRCIELMERNLDYAGEVLGDKSYDAPLLVTSLNLYDFPISHEEERVLVMAACLLWREDGMLQNPIRMYALFPRPKQGGSVVSSKSMGYCALNAELAKYFLSAPDYVDSIVKIIAERRITSPTEIDAILKSSASPVLAEGAL